jgi:alpha-tubulin suppressor-like RCC1 family protein
MDGTLWCWGINSRGEIGDGTTTERTTPVQVTSLGSAVASVSSGKDHTCAILTNGTLWCWGYNEWGQLGDGTTIDRDTPVQVTALGSSLSTVSCSDSYTCAALTDGTLWCWGYNGAGQLGDGTTTPRLSPEQIAVGSGGSVVSLSTGGGDACVILSSGTLWCWGNNNSGQLASTASGLTPVQIAALGNGLASASVGGGFECAVLTNGTLWCWGTGSGGALGQGSPTGSDTPGQVTALGSSVASVAAGTSVTCATLTNGTLWCWGSNELGEIGDGTVIERNTPVQVFPGP